MFDIQLCFLLRNIGYGALNMASRVGAIVAPQLVFMVTVPFLFLMC